MCLPLYLSKLTQIRVSPVSPTAVWQPWRQDAGSLFKKEPASIAKSCWSLQHFLRSCHDHAFPGQLPGSDGTWQGLWGLALSA